MEGARERGSEGARESAGRVDVDEVGGRASAWWSRGMILA